MVDGSNTRAMGRLAGLAYLAMILASGAGCLAAARLLTADPRSPLGCAASIGELGTCAWLLILAPAPATTISSAPASPWTPSPRRRPSRGRRAASASPAHVA